MTDINEAQIASIIAGPDANVNGITTIDQAIAAVAAHDDAILECMSDLAPLVDNYVASESDSGRNCASAADIMDAILSAARAVEQ
jgi:ABC-type transporter Mla subunit MlaD